MSSFIQLTSLPCESELDSVTQLSARSINLSGQLHHSYHHLTVFPYHLHPLRLRSPCPIQKADVQESAVKSQEPR